MSEQAAVEPEEEQRQPAENEENGGDEQPDIEPDEQADMGELADLAEQVEEEAGADVDDDNEDTEDESDSEASASGSPSPADAGETADWGDLYCSTVTTGLNAVIEEYGRDDAEKIDESLARDLHLDDYVNKWMAEQDRGEMDPAQGMLIATATLAITVLVSRTDIPSKVLNKAKSDD